ncbi:MAG TPA: DUF6461 domain-containing protein [Ktedonobacteraceae bacterium]|nr:DUF6461 domain-containing protein [Ktedonobacteraceae bacterium]
MFDGLSHLNQRFSPFCVTFARGLDESEMLNRLGGDPSHAWLIPCGDLNAVQDLEVYKDLDIWQDLNGPILQVGRCGDWAFAIELMFEYQGTRPEVLCALAARTVAVSVYRDINALTLLSSAENGVPLEQFEASDPLPDRLQTMLRQAGVDPNSENWNAIQLMSTLLEALGIRLGEEDLAKLLFTGMVNPLP